ncbi:TRAP transporter small permease [Acidimangrovimonas pyrenivorans]|uniref:TRAP transporter small permease protein n=1 Tax=Acidimangrovimonas pyrenivorans TaxID=2030798 RepID=A0ABV7AGT6_9RHOB
MERLAAALLRTITGLERWVLILGYVLMTGLLLLDTLGREFFGAGLFGANIYATNALIYAAMAGFGLATASGRHLRPRFADGLVPAVWEPAVRRAGQLVSGLILTVIAATAVQFVVETFSYGERNQVTGLALWPIQLALPLGFAFSALRHFCYALWPSLAPVEGSADE